MMYNKLEVVTSLPRCISPDKMLFSTEKFLCLYKIICCGTHSKCLIEALLMSITTYNFIEALLMSTYNIRFHRDVRKNICGYSSYLVL